MATANAGWYIAGPTVNKIVRAGGGETLQAGQFQFDHYPTSDDLTAVGLYAAPRKPRIMHDIAVDIFALTTGQKNNVIANTKYTTTRAGRRRRRRSVRPVCASTSSTRSRCTSLVSTPKPIRSVNRSP